MRTPLEPREGSPFRLPTEAGNRALSRLLAPMAAPVDRQDRAPTSEDERMQGLQQSRAFERDPLMSSMRNRFIDLYEQIASHPPETYLDNLYPQMLPAGENEVLPTSATEPNYSAAASSTANTPVNNRARWALQATLAQYAIEHGHDAMVARAQSSTEFSYQIHRHAFRFAGDSATIGRLPWAILTEVNVPALGQLIGETIYGPEAFFAGIEAGLEHIARDPLDAGGANAAFDAAYNSVMSKKYALGGQIINWTIESTNAPGGYGDMPWWGIGLRVIIDGVSAFSPFCYD